MTDVKYDRQNLSTQKTPRPWTHAASHRVRARNPFEAQLPPLHTRFGHGLAADVLDTIDTCRVTPLLQRSIDAMWTTSRAAPCAPDYGLPAAPAPGVHAWLSHAARVPALLGAAIGLVVDTIVVAVALLCALPALLVFAFIKARAPKGLSIDRDALSLVQLEEALQRAIRDHVAQESPIDGDGISKQFENDINRQTMGFAFGQDGPIVPLAKDLVTALPVLRAMCTGDDGVVDKAWLWAVTDMSAQGLLNEVYAQLLQNDAMTFASQACTVSLNGQTTITVRRTDANVVSISAVMLAPKGVQVGLLGPTDGPGFVRDATPLRLEVEVCVTKPVCCETSPRLRVARLAFGPLLTP